MTPSKKRKLQLVPYEPDNYTPGEVLALDDATVVKSDKAIGSALSLYFQWEKKRSCHVTFAKEAGALLCEMDYDHDEASPTEIRIQLKKTPKRGFKLVPGSTVLIRFEIFRVTYVFTSVVTAVATDPKLEGWHSIIEVPSELRVLKTRHLPRLVLDDAGRKKLPKASWTSESGSAFDLKLLEIGMGSVRASFTGEAVAEKDKSGVLSFGEALVSVEVVRCVKGEIILKLNFVDHKDFGTFWDYYRLVAYPSMRSRYEVPFEEGIELYEKSNYFGVFNSKKSTDEKLKLIATWRAIKSGFHKTNVDYYIVNHKGEPCGSSGLALTNFSKNEAVWSFHQLCAIKDPSLLAETGVLYTWRAEYLEALPGPLMVWGTFRSKSRWLERIYVKHSLTVLNEDSLISIFMKRCLVPSSGVELLSRFKKYNVGDQIRYATETINIWGGINPPYLNANGNLDTVIALDSKKQAKDLKEIASGLVAKVKEKEKPIQFIVPRDTNLDEIQGIPQVQDRLFKFHKEGLSNFIASVEHSVAVTEKKFPKWRS